MPRALIGHAYQPHIFELSWSTNMTAHAHYQARQSMAATGAHMEYIMLYI